MDVVLLGELTEIIGNVSAEVVDNVSVNFDNKHNEVMELLNEEHGHGSVIYKNKGTYAWTCPDGVGLVYVVASGGSGGGGGGGGGCYYSSSWAASGGGGGGGGGATAAVIEAILPVIAGKTYNLIIGAGGAGGSGGTLSTADKRAGTGGAGGAGGDTFFDDLLVAKGATGGTGGTGGATTTDTSSASWTKGTGGTGGKGLSSTTGISTENIIVSLFEAKDGTNGADGKYRWSSVNVMEGSNGGVSSKNIIGISGGNGGAGGDCEYNNVTNGSVGATGSDGYIKIFW